MQRQLPEAGRGKGAVHLVGGGKSLDPARLKGRKNVCAINQAHDHLIENGVVPAWCTLLDPVPQIAEQVTPHPKVRYYLASQCDPSVFDKLDGYDVQVFHVENSVAIDDLVDSPLRVEGGTSTILRAWVLHWLRGHGVFHFWGFDCCYDEGGTHAYKHRYRPDNIATMEIDVGDRVFLTEPGLARQAKHFFEQLQQMKRIRPPVVQVHGNGLVATLARNHGLLH